MTQFKYPLPTQQYIHGEYVDSKGSERFTLKSSVDGSVVSEAVQCANAADVEAAVESAEKALKIWSGFTPIMRRKVLLNFADLIEKNSQELGYLETVLVGKPISSGAVWESAFTAEWFRYYAGFTDKFQGESFPTDDGFFKVVHHEPLGICAAINAFNSPMITFAMKAAPALCVGNVMISKASEMNPFSTLVLGRLAVEAGIPPGVLNIIVGSQEAGQALSSHMKIRKISFTGSVQVGRKIQIAATQSNLKRVTLELGGKSPVLIFEDADLENAVECASHFLRLNGQGCVLGTRIYVQESIAEKFVAALKTQVDKYGETLGADPHDQTTMSSPLYHQAQFERVITSIEKGKLEAEVITGGNRHGDKGCYVQPTLFYKPKAGSDILTKEVFGPVAVIDTFKTEEEVLIKANDSDYGLGASVYTADLDRALRLSTGLESGTVTINCSDAAHTTMPFGGVKSSGIGRENGIYALREYTQPKAIIIKMKALVQK